MKGKNKKGQNAAIHMKEGKGPVIMGYDMKLKKKVRMLDAKLVTMKNGRHAYKGKSAESGINMFVIKSKD